MIANLKPYPSMKDSGVEWLRDVPGHWDTSKIKGLARPGYKTFVDGDWIESPYITTDGIRLIQTGNIGTGEYREKGFRYISEETFTNFCCTEIKPGDILICRLGEPVSRACIAPQLGKRMITSVDVCILKARENIHAKFLVYSMSSWPYLDWVGSLVRGSTRDRVSRSMLGSFLLPLPPLAEQVAIVRFLDHADRRILRYIRAKQKLVKLLEEQKQAIIHQAVTGQIDVRTGQPYPAYKTSGVDWLGEVPQGWERCRLRNIVSVVTTGSRGWSSYASDKGPLFIRVANLSRGSLRLRFDDLVRLDLPVTSEAGRTRIEAGDLLLSVTAYIGSVGVVPEGFEEAYVSQHVARCRPLPRMHARWLGYVLLSTVGQTHGQMSLYGGTKDGLSLDDVKNYPILLPPHHEQEQAVRWIEGRLSALLKIGDGAKRQIELVREYRTRLIADVVTGKLDVREAAARLPEVDPLADEFDVLTEAPETGVMELEDATELP